MSSNSILRSLGVCAFYGSCSVITSLVNKAVLASWGFKFSFTLLAMQLLACIVLCTILSTLGVIKHTAAVDRGVLLRLVFVSTLFICNVSAGFVGLRLVSIPMFLALRRTNPMFTLVMEYFLLGRVASSTVWMALSVIAVGALVAGAGDLTADYFGYLFVGLNNLGTSAYACAVSKFNRETGMSSMDLLVYNAYIALPLTVALAFLMGEVGEVLAFPALLEPSFMLTLLLSSCIGTVLSFSIFLCTLVNSPVATAVTGNLKDIFSTAISIFILQDVAPTPHLVAGICLSLTGSLLYSWIKLNQQQGSAAAATSTTEAKGAKQQ